MHSKENSDKNKEKPTLIEHNKKLWDKNNAIPQHAAIKSWIPVNKMFINASLLWKITQQLTLPQNIMERCGIFVNYVWEFLKHKHENFLTYNWH